MARVLCVRGVRACAFLPHVYGLSHPLLSFHLVWVVVACHARLQ